MKWWSALANKLFSDHLHPNESLFACLIININTQTLSTRLKPLKLSTEVTSYGLAESPE